MCFVRAFALCVRYKHYFSKCLYGPAFGGGENMRSSSFEETITCHFDALIKIVIYWTLKSHKRTIARRSKRELPFCVFNELLNICGVNDTYPSDVIRLCVCSITIPVSDNELARQYNNLQQNSVKLSCCITLWVRMTIK